MKNKKSWGKFNKKLQIEYNKKEPETDTDFEKLMQVTMDKTLEKITIKTGTYNPKLTEKAKELKEIKKKAKKPNKVGNWRGIEDKFFNNVRKGFINLMKPPK